MEFKIDKLDGFILVKVQKAKLDTTVAPSLKSELILLSGNGEKNILLDLDMCTYCDSSGLSAILVANRLCKTHDGIFVLSGLQPAVERMIAVSQLDTVLNIAPTLDDGIEIMRKSIQRKEEEQKSK